MRRKRALPNASTTESVNQPGSADTAQLVDNRQSNMSQLHQSKANDSHQIQRQRRLSEMANQAPIQRYTEEDNNYSVSTNRKFAVQNEGQDGRLFALADTPLPDLQHVTLRNGGTVQVNGTDMKEVIADFDNQEAMDEMFCGKFSESVTGIDETEENGDAPVGRSLYTGGVTHDDESISAGWENHFAPVILQDGGDRGTLETAVGIPFCWFGIYGQAKGQTFRYKTQYANIIRSMFNEWIDQETGQRILTELVKYKDNEIEDEALHAYTIKEVLKLKSIAEAGPVDLSDKESAETPAPASKRQTRELLARENTGDVFKSSFFENADKEEKERQQFIYNSLMAVGVAGLSILAWYMWPKS